MAHLLFSETTDILFLKMACKGSLSNRSQPVTASVVSVGPCGVDECLFDFCSHEFYSDGFCFFVKVSFFLHLCVYISSYSIDILFNNSRNDLKSQSSNYIFSYSVLILEVIEWTK